MKQVRFLPSFRNEKSLWEISSAYIKKVMKVNLQKKTLKLQSKIFWPEKKVFFGHPKSGNRGQNRFCKKKFIFLP